MFWLWIGYNYTHLFSLSFFSGSSFGFCSYLVFDVGFLEIGLMDISFLSLPYYFLHSTYISMYICTIESTIQLVSPHLQHTCIPFTFITIQNMELTIISF